MRDLLERIGRPNSFTWQVAAIAIVPSLLIVLAGPWARSGGSPLPWIGFALCGTAVATVLMLPFRATVLKAGDRPARTLITLIAFALAGAVRGVIIGQLASSAGLLPHPETGQRIVGGALCGLVSLSIIALMVQSVRDHADSSRRLAAQRARLAIARASVRTELNRVSAEIVERVRMQMIARLETVAEVLGGAGGRFADGAQSIVGLIDSTLKPLVDEISSRPAEWNVDLSESEGPDDWDRRALLRDTTLISPINPAVTAVAIALVSGASFIPLAGPLRMAAASAVVLTELRLLLALCIGPMKRAARTLGALQRAVVLTLLVEICGLWSRPAFSARGASWVSPFRHRSMSASSSRRLWWSCSSSGASRSRPHGTGVPTRSTPSSRRLSSR